MPTSDPSQISTIVAALVELQPRRVLDVGPGYGKYGVLCQEYLGPILERLDAAEPWPQGMMQSLVHMYNSVYGEPFPGPLGKDGWVPYDLVLMVDVLEHYTEIEGHEALRVALDVAPVVLLATPRNPEKQGAVSGNPWERHRSRWTVPMLGYHGLAEVYPHPTQLIARLERNATP